MTFLCGCPINLSTVAQLYKWFGMTEQKEAVSIGIDLGTTFSVVAYVDENGTPQIISSSEGGRLFPSVFAITPNGDELVGQLAIDQEVTNSSNTIRSVKRFMGQYDEESGLPKRVTLGGKEWSPEEISSKILAKIKRDAEAYLQREVKQAVITVPAYFGNDQRRATIVAGELAGLEVLRIINEPTAGAIAYGLDKREDARILVYDLGGGTFDVTLMQIVTVDEDGGLDFDVRSTAGDTRLGGDDFDQKIIDILIRRFMEANPTITADRHPIYQEAMTRLRNAAESAKKQLSSTSVAHVSIPYLMHVDGEPLHLNTTVTIEEFNAAIAPLIKRTKDKVELALRDAKIRPREIDEVVFVGGSTRVPAVFDAVKQWIGIIPNRTINPDEAVAIGAAVHAAQLTGQIDEGIILYDVTPLTLGIELAGGLIRPMIKRNKKIPTEASDEFTTAEDNQAKIHVRVYQGERPMAKHNRKISEFYLTGLEPKPKGEDKIDVTFKIDVNGILSVRAVDQATGAEKEIIVTGTSSLTDEEIKAMLDDAKANKAQDEKELRLFELTSKLKERLRQAETLLATYTNALSEETVLNLKDLIVSINDALTTEQLEYLEESEKAARKVIQDVGEVIYQQADAAIRSARGD